MRIDLNADLGETNADAELLVWVSSCNIACGGHAGDAASMNRIVQLAQQHGVAIGAHPSLPDRIGFGRRDIDIERDALRESVRRQIEDLMAIAVRQGVSVRHVKPHGALYHQMARDPAIAQLVAAVVVGLDPQLALVGPSWGEWVTVAQRFELLTIIEGFADRRYLENGTLAPRTEPNALLHGTAAIEQGVRLARGGPPRIDTLCVHGDGSDALTLTRNLRKAIIDAGIEIRAC